ncbi:MAG: hypothetical protein JW913_17875 [Chitinispirillaceae bacterium]|nr:hypothetical protein [Chitinispirillaceae bacterium]
MSEINVQLSVTQLAQIDRHQNDAHRTPAVHQEQNAQRAHEEATRRLAMPVEPDTVEKKRIDPEDKRNDRNERRKKQRRKAAQDEEPPPMQQGGSPLIDIQA